MLCLVITATTDDLRYSDLWALVERLLIWHGAVLPLPPNPYRNSTQHAGLDATLSGFGLNQMIPFRSVMRYSVGQSLSVLKMLGEASGTGM